MSKEAYGAREQELEAVPEVASRPMAELPVKSSKYVKSCTELYLGNKGLTVIRNFEPFIHLDTLWLNKNKLQRITNLDKNFRIKHLYVQHNRIESLKGSIQRFKFLTVLHCSHNNLTNFAETMEVLSKLAHLKVLDLFANPISEEVGFRPQVIHTLTNTLEVLDRIYITEQDRNEAHFLCRRGLNQQLEMPSKRSPEELAGKWSACAEMLFEQVEETMRKRQIHKLSLPVIPSQAQPLEQLSGRRKLPLGKYLDFRNRSLKDGNLAIWEQFRLVHMLDTAGSHGVTFDVMKQVLLEFKDYSGKTPKSAEVNKLRNLFGKSSNPRDEDPQESSENTVDPAELVKALTTPELRWTNADKAKLRERSDSLFKMARSYYHDLTSINSSIEDEQESSAKEAFQKQILCATRLQCMGFDETIAREEKSSVVHRRKDFYFDRPHAREGIVERGQTTDMERGREEDVPEDVLYLARRFGIEKSLARTPKQHNRSPFQDGPLYI